MNVSKTPSKVITRQEARGLGLKYYFPGPCKNKHTSWRHTNCGGCLACIRERVKQRYNDNPTYKEMCSQAAKRHYKKVGTKWYHANKEHAAQLNKEWREQYKEKFSKYCVEWRQNNRGKLSKNAATYRAKKLQATPTWIDEKAVEALYAEATRRTEQTGVQYTVDHIIPLNSDVVCGLHWEGNLQLLTRKENSCKSNKVIQ